MEEHDRLLTLSEVAALFHVSNKTVRRWVAERKLERADYPGGQHRFRESYIQAMISGQPQGRPADASPGSSPQRTRAGRGHP